MKNIKKILISVLIAILIMAIGVAGINIYVVEVAKNHIISDEDAASMEADCIIVLGAAVKPDGSPSLMLKERLDRSIYLFETGKTDVLLMSGDNGTVEYNEVAAMKEYAINSGISEKNIFTDHAGFSTYESMYRLRDVFLADSAIVVTQEYHLYRALYIGEKLGLDVYGVPSDTRKYSGQLYRDVREVFARVKSFFYVLTDKQPKYLGDPIPLEVI